MAIEKTGTVFPPDKSQRGVTGFSVIARGSSGGCDSPPRTAAGVFRQRLFERALADGPATIAHSRMERENLPLDRRLRQEILLARGRVYRFDRPTPLERLTLPGPGPEIWVKREDLSIVKSYKWRGACNRMAVLGPGEAKRGVVTASAGNHAQGLALAARQLGVHARIYMPRSTPRVKQQAVLHHGGEFVEIHLAGDAYDEAVEAARRDEAASGALYIHAYDDLLVMAGQGTLADEIVLSGHGPFDAAFLQIGGGGLAAGVSTWLKTYWPDIRITGVEGIGQASMRAAFVWRVWKTSATTSFSFGTLMSLPLLSFITLPRWSSTYWNPSSTSRRATRRSSCTPSGLTATVATMMRASRSQSRQGPSSTTRRRKGWATSRLKVSSSCRRKLPGRMAGVWFSTTRRTWVSAR